MLAPRALRPVRVDAQVALVDVDVAVLREQRRRDHLGERGVPAVSLVERTEPDEPMLPALRTQDAVGVLALDGEGRGLQTCFLPRARLDDFGLEAAAVGPAFVHPQEHLGEVLCIGAADVGLQRDDRVTGVVLAAEERFFLEAFELLPQWCDRFGDLVVHVAVHRVELLRVLVVARELLVAVEFPCDTRVLGGDRGRAFLVVPETGLSHLCL